MADSVLLDSLYYEISYVTGGMDAGEAKAKGSLKALESAADQLGVKMTRVSADVATSTAKIGASLSDIGKGAEKPAADAGRRIGAAISDGVAKASPGKLAGEQLVAGLRTKLEASKADITRAVEAGLMSPAEAESAGRAAGKQYVSGIREGLASLKAQGVPIADADLTGIYRNAATAITPVAKEAAAAAGAIEKVGSASAEAGRGGLGTMSRALAAVVARTTGVNGSVARLVSTLGNMTEGAALTIGVTAALGAIGLAYEYLTKSARATRAAIDKVIEGLNQQRVTEAYTANQRAAIAVGTADADVERLTRQVSTLQSGGNLLTAAHNDPENANDYLWATVDRTRALTNATHALAEAKGIAAKASNLQAQTSRDVQSGLVQELSGAAKLGAATETNIADLKAQSDQAKIALAAFTAPTAAGRLARLDFRIKSAGATDADVLKEQQRLKEMADSYDKYVEGVKKADDKLTAAHDRAAKSAESSSAKIARASETRTAALNNFREQLDALKASLTPESADNFTAALARLDEKARTLKLTPKEQLQYAGERKEIVDANAAKVAADAEVELNKLLAEQAGHVDTVREKFDALIKTYQNRGASDAVIAQFAALRDKAVTAADALEKVAAAKLATDNALSSVESNIEGRGIGLGTGTPLGDMSKLLGQLDDQNAKLAAINVSTGDVNAKEKERRDTVAEIARIMRDIKTLQDDTTKSTNKETAAEQAAKTARAQYVDSIHADFNAALQGAEQVASAFGKIDQHTQLVLQGIQDWGNAAAAFAKGDVVTGAIDTIEGAVSIATGLLRKPMTAEEKQANAAVNQNTQALIRLTSHIGDIGKITASGADTRAFLAAINASNVTGETKTHKQEQTDRLAQNLNSAGYTLDELRSFAQQFGITLSTIVSGREIEQLKTAIAASTPTEFGRDFAGQMSQLDAAVKLFPDLTDPIKQFDAFRAGIDRIKGGGGVLATALKNFDLTTADGVKAAEGVLQDLFNRTQAGTISTTDLGGLSGQDFLSAILKAQDYAKGQETATAQAGTGGFNVDRTITDVTGSRLAALFSTGNVFAEMTAANTAGILAKLGGTAAPVIMPPVMPASAFASSTASTSTQSITFAAGAVVLNVTPPAGSDPTAYGAALSDAFIQSVSQKLQAANDWAKRSQGEMS